MINRAPLHASPVGIANIKTLRSAIDRVADLAPDAVRDTPAEGYAALRAHLAPMEGLIAIYPISHHSAPANGQTNSRRQMQAPSPLIGYSITFPSVTAPGSASARSYWAVTPDWAPEIPDEDPEESVFHDSEGDKYVTVPGGGQ